MDGIDFVILYGIMSIILLYWHSMSDYTKDDGEKIMKKSLAFILVCIIVITSLIYAAAAVFGDRV